MKLKREYKLFGIFGYPLSHTLSPGMHEAAFRDKGLPHFYLSLELSSKSFRKSMKALAKLSLDGFNITVPYKETIMPYLHKISPQAKAIGAVNTVYKKKNKWCGTNTDVDGFLTALKVDGNFFPRNKRILIFGAGGASRAAIYGLASSKAKTITIVNRTSSRAKKLISEFKKRFPKVEFNQAPLTKAGVSQVLKEVDLVVNTTSIGLKKSDKALISSSWIPNAVGKNRILFYDMVYHRKETPFLKAAKAKRHKGLNGMGMLLYQGAKAFEIWTNKKAPISIMKKKLIETLS